MAAPFDPFANAVSARTQLLDQLSSGMRVDPKAAGAIDLDAVTGQSEFTKGLRRAGYGMSATSQAFLGQMAEPVAPDFARRQFDAAQQTMQRMPQSVRPEYETFEQARGDGLRGLGSYAMGALGEGLPSIGMNLVGGGVGGVAARALGRSVTAGRLAGGTATMLPMEGGETALDIQQDPQALANTTPAERAALTLGRGSVNALAESVVPQMLIAPRLMGQAARVGPGLGNAVRNTALTAGAGALGEYGTEAAQDLTGQAALKIARGDSLTSGYDLAQANEAGIRGAITGGGVGAVAGGVQALTSNIGAGADAARDAASERATQIRPVLDRAVTRLDQMLNDPKQFGADMTNMTLAGMADLAAKAESGSKLFGKSVVRGADVLSDIKDQVDRFVIQNIAPENRETYANLTEKLNLLTPSESQLVRKALTSETADEAKEALGLAAASLTERTGQGAKNTWSWLKDVGSGVAEAVNERRAPDAPKQSFIINRYEDTERRDLERTLKAGDPAAYDTFRKASISERRQLADILLSARDNPGYFAATKEDGTPLRQNIIDGWQKSTGTDIRQTVDKLNQWRNAETLRKAEAKAGRTGDVDAELVKMERQMPGATDKENLLSEDNLRRNTTKLAEETAGATFDESGNVMDEDKPYTTPFDLKTFQDSLAATNFDKDNPGRGGVEVKLVADGLKPSELAQLVGKKEAVKAGDKWEGRSSPYSAQELAKFDEDGAVTTRVNLQSLWGTAQNEANRAKFSEFIDAYSGDRTTEERAGDAGFTLLAQLGTDGFKIPMADGREVSVKVQLPENAEQAIQGDMVIRRAGKGKKPYTYADYRGDSRRAVAREKQLAVLDEAQTPVQLRTLAQGGNKAAEKAGKIIYARAATAAGGKPSAQQLEAAFGEYRTELGEKIKNSETGKRVQRDTEILREALINGDLSQSDIEKLAKYYSEGGGGITFFDAKRIMSSVGARKGNKLMSRKDSGAAMLGEQLRAMAEDVSLRQEGFYDSITGRNAGNPSDSVDQEFRANMLEPQQRANTRRQALRANDPATPVPAIDPTYTSPRAENPVQGDSGRIVPVVDGRPQPPVAAPSAAPAPAATTVVPEGTPVKQLPYMGERGEALRPRVSKAIAEAKTPEALQKIGNSLKLFTSRMPEEDVTALRSEYAAKQAELKKPTAKRSVDNTPPTPPDDVKAARERFVKGVEKLVGKRIAVLFNEKLEQGVAGEFTSRDDALEKVRDRRRRALKELERPAGNRETDLSDGELRTIIKNAEAKEQRILDDKAVLGVIRVAAGMESKAGLAEHEAFHGAFAFFFSATERKALGTAFSQGLVSKRLKEYFKDQPEVLKAIAADPEEAASYGFQVWMHDPSVLKLGDKAQTMFGKLKEFLRKIFGLMTPEQRALLILNDLKSGRRAERGTSPLAKQLDKDRPWTERAQQLAQDIGGFVKSGYDIVFTGVYDRLVDMENPAITAIAKKVYSATGEEGRSGMVQRTIAETRRYYNEVARIYDGLTDQQLLDLHDANVFDKEPTDPVAKERWERVNKLYKDLYAYQRSAGVDLKNAGIESNYYPLTWDPEKVLKNKDAFLKMLAKYEDKLATSKKTPEEIWEGITAYIERGEDLVNVMGATNEPLAEHVRTRTLAFIEREDRRPFMSDDPVGTTMRYVKQAVRQAEFVRDFGMGGSELTALKAEAKDRYGATNDDLALVNDYIDGALGNKEAGMSRELKDVYGGLAVYQNIRLLPFSIFASLVDPMGIAVRSNSVGDAWKTFSYSIKNLFRDWKSEYTPDQWEKIAADWGIIEQSGTTVNTDALYNGITLRGTTKKINDTFFKYNLLNGWIRNNHIMAVASAQRFFQRAAEGMFKDNSARYLEEVGLSKDDVIYNEQLGRILMRKDELVAAGKTEAEAEAIEGRLQEATRKFVRQSLLNPTAPELANWASNPYMAPIAHLKQFVWAFNATIINRITHELENNNYKPLMLAAAYVPAMIAADFLRDMVSNFGEEPPYKKDWGVVDYVQSGIQRSGLTGTGMFFIDAQEDIMRGGSGLESMGGPALEQLKKAVSAFSSGDTGAIERWMVKALPANAVYDQVLLN